MKKILLTFLAAAGITIGANAQLALETFDSGLPSTWSMISDGHTVSTSFTGYAWIQDSLDLHAWMDVWGIAGSSSDGSMLTTSYFSPAATANRWLITPSFLVSDPNTVIEWQDYDLGSGEPIHIYVSATAGTTIGAFGTTPIYDAPSGSGGLVTHMVPIGAWSGTNITVAFVDDTTNNWGVVLDNVQTTILPSYNLDVTAMYIYPYVKTGSSNTITGMLTNNGIITTTSTDLVYSVNGGAPVTTTLSGLSIPLSNTYTYTSSTPWVPTTAGIYTIKVWVDNINGTNADAIPASDTLTTVVSVIDALQPKTVLIEEFNQASCDPCAEATPNVDSVYTNNLAIANMVRYHVNFPGRDCMDSVTLAPFVQDMLTYYNVSGVPDAQVDGQYVYPGAGYLTTGVLTTAAAIGSPVGLHIDSASYDASTYTYTFTASIAAVGDLPAGLIARAALIVDTITYAANQSTESIPQYVFPEVAENMFPNAAGTTLGAFTNGSSQTVTLSWVKNHPWGSARSVWAYDSTANCKIVFWVINNDYDYVYQSTEEIIPYVTPTGINAVTSANGSMNVYPNPANSTATVSLNLINSSNVKMEVMDASGKLVYSLPVENRNSGSSNVTFNVAGFANGEYFVKVTIGDEVLTKKLTVAK